MDTYADDLSELIEHLDLKDTVMIGISASDAEVANHFKKPLAMADTGLKAARFPQRHFALATIGLNMKMFILMSLLMFISNSAFSKPSHFSNVIGSALQCDDQVSAIYFNDYMKTYFGTPEFTSGGANWWKVSDTLFNSQLEYIFVGAHQDFIGATFKDTPDKLMENIKNSTGLAYKQAGVGKWVASTYSVIIKYDDNTTPSKMFCIGSPYSPSIS